MYKNIVSTVLVFLYFNLTLADNNQEFTRAQVYLQKQNEVFFSFAVTPNTDLDKLSKIISLDHQDGQVMYAYANSNEFNEFLKENIEYIVEKPAGEDYNPESAYKGDLNDYHGQKLLNYDEYLAYLKKCETDNPEICKTYEIGQSGKGKTMLCLRITSGLKSDENPKRPRFLFASAVHGDELNGTLVGYGLIDFMIKGYRNQDHTAKKYLDGVDLWVAPHLNPDGTYPNGNTMSGCKRANGSGTDLNRSYPAPQISRAEYDKIMNNLDYSAPETKVTIAFQQKYQFNMDADNHDAMKEVIVHWSSKTPVPHTMPWMKAVGGKFAKAVGWAGPTQAANSSGGTAVGTRMDWGPFYGHCWGFTLEYTNKGTSPQCNWTGFKNPVLGLLDDAMCGISGTIIDGSGKGVAGAKIVLKKGGTDWDKNGSDAVSRDNGYYVHYAPAGTYDVVFTAAGKSKTVPNITVTDGKPTPLNVNMDNTDIISSQSIVSQKITLISQPNGITINCKTSDNNGSISVYAINGTLLLNTNLNSLPNNTITLNNASFSTAKGCYIVQMNVAGKTYSEKFVLSR